MPIYKQTTELTKIADFLTATEHDITEVYFGNKQVFTVWGEYDGTLPAQYTANGDYLADYRIYGASGGVGDKTENLWDDNETISGYVKGDGSIGSSNNSKTSDYIDVENVNNLTLSYEYTVLSNLNFRGYAFYDLEKNIIETIQYYTPSLRGFSTVVPTSAKYIRVTVDKNVENIILSKDSTAPSEYVPYGYVVPMSVSDGSTATTTQIHIGSDPLGEDEYVDYGEGKIYRRTENRFNPAAYTATGQYLTYAGGLYAGAAWRISDYIPVTSGETYTITSLVGQYPAYCWYNSNKEYISGARYEISGGFANSTITAPANAAYLRFSYVFDSSSASYNENKCMVIEDSTAPSTHIPYLQPTDPPVPLPALPTVDGTTITDYAGQSAAVPSRFVAKYRKENF